MTNQNVFIETRSLDADDRIPLLGYLDESRPWSLTNWWLKIVTANFTEDNFTIFKYKVLKIVQFSITV
jgi:hypothetical protein